MARKGLMSGLLEDDEFTAVNSTDDAAPAPRSGRGAFGMMSRAADEMATKVEAAEEIEKQLLIGDTIIEVDPNDLEGSFVSDRISDDRFDELVEAIRERGQDSPILVRPHPSIHGRYQIVFGHRRTRAAKELGIKVRAVVKELGDREHVIAQGQENTAREDLSFIERTLFAARLNKLGFDNPTVMSALAINKTILSKMTSVIDQVPESVILSMGAAKGIGREKWYDLSVKCRDREYLQQVQTAIAGDTFAELSVAARFAALMNLQKLPVQKSSIDKKVEPTPTQTWVAPDKSVQAVVQHKGHNLKLSLKAGADKGFGQYLSENLDQIFEAYVASKTEPNRS
ncbi:plasmid partitioning protein RepB [Phyllobacterium sp. TAF24]|uniref:plasmid partitioning protein RepB n=1 Tax=Phyllobacterium sp. TAF24 TaxID=3233068 RepID=UPI003F989299